MIENQSSNNQNARGSYQRKFLSISNKKFQKEFVALIVFVAFSSSLLVLLGTWFMMQQVFSIASEFAITSGPGVEQKLVSQATSIWLMMITVCVINIVCILVFAFWFSKRASGIVYRVTKDLNRLSDGEAVAPIVPREGDFFMDLVKAANRLIEKR